MTRAEKAVLHCDPYFFACVGGYPTRLASVDGIRAKYGKRSVTRASLMNCGAAASRGIGFSGE